MESIFKFLNLNKVNKLNIAVIGDVMIDEYYDVKVNRISPEFPTQIMKSDEINPTTTCPGGAANVCLQMSNGFNVDCSLFCFCDDYSLNVLNRQKFTLNYVKIDGNIPLKKRFYDGDYPLPRWDIEKENYGCTLKQLEEYKLELFYKFICKNKQIKFDIVIFSDYGKGLFTDIFSNKLIEYCSKNKIKTLVDPKDLPLEKWFGCDYFKPNSFEAVNMSGIPNPNDNGGAYSGWVKHAKYFQSRGIKDVIITCGAGTPFITYKDNVPDIKLAKLPNKQSVIGAGDCFCAFLSMCLSHKMSLEESAEVAWNASSFYIESKHNKPLMPHELAKWGDSIRSKIVSVEDLKIIMDYDKCVWVWTNGCFDILHIGHLKTLEESKKIGDKVIVGLNTDESIRKLKGDSRPILNFDKRAEHLAHLQYVDFIVPVDEITPEKIIKEITPNKIVKGGDYKKEEISGIKTVGENNVHIIPLVNGISTTNIISKAKNE